MKRTKSQATPARKTENHRDFLAGPVVVGCRIEHDLGHRFGDEIGELEFLDGTVAVDGQAQCVACAGGLAQRGAKNTRPAEIANQSLRNFECTAIGPDILAEDDRLGAFG